MTNGMEAASLNDGHTVEPQELTVEFVSTAALEFKDISSEEWREYLFPNGDKVKIDQPLKLCVSESGGHRVFDGHGLSHYIAPTWISITWRAKEGQPNFVL